MGRAGGLLVDGTAEEHLRIGALEDAGDAGGFLFLGRIIFFPTRSLSAVGAIVIQTELLSNCQFNCWA